MNYQSKLRVFAFYLPQFHPIRQNDTWWGKGFTEWRNVVLSKSRFFGHYQPHLPADLGFYDLRLKQVHLDQAGLAKRAGIDGFCYYHYWFNGETLLDEPIEVLLANKDIDISFMMCWANENWSRRWDGKDQEILIAQDYSKYDSKSHIEYLNKFFADERYAKVDGKPILVVYRANQIKNLTDNIAQWHESARRMGFPGLYLMSISTSKSDDDQALNCGFDRIIDFQPSKNHPQRGSGIKFIKYIFDEALSGRLKIKIIKLYPHIEFAKIFSYRKLVQQKVNQDLESSVIPCVMPSWDNSARRRTDSTIIQNNDHLIYGRWLQEALSKTRKDVQEERFVFINAWNEWAEGCHLEPDLKNGLNFIDETRIAIDKDEIR